MSDDTHRDDAAAWVLGALPDDEVVAFRMRLRADPELAAEVTRLQPVADILPMAAEQTAPPRELRARVMDVVWAEAARAPAEAPPARRGLRTWFTTMLRRRPAYALGIAAACLAIGIGIGIGVGGGGTSTRTFDAKVTAPGGAAQLVVDDAHAQLHVSRFPAPPPGHVYEVWLLRAGATKPEPTDALFKVSTGGSATVDVPGGVKGVAQVMVTAEPDGGSKVPTTTPILVAQPS